MLIDCLKFDSKFIPAIEAIKVLAKYDEYMAAFLFGSAARNVLTEESDLDVFVVTKESLGVTHILHPELGGVKLDLSFNTFEQFKFEMEKMILI